MIIPPTSFVTLGQFLHNITLDHDLGLGWVFRGQSDCSKPLLPKAGREEYYCRATSYWKNRRQSSSDLGRFKEWRDQAVAISNELPGNDFECLAYAQHYGLATRLLDWTDNPLVALFFSAEQAHDIDGAVFFYLPSIYVDAQTAALDSFDVVALYRPRPFDRRIAAQGGVFTYHPNPLAPLEPTEIPQNQRVWIDDLEREVPQGMNLRAVRVEAKLKPLLLRELAKVGISRRTLFPDLEGLSSHINWETNGIADRQRRPDDTGK
jgi:hypothetical protein